MTCRRSYVMTNLQLRRAKLLRQILLDNKGLPTIEEMATKMTEAGDEKITYQMVNYLLPCIREHGPTHPELKGNIPKVDRGAARKRKRFFWHEKDFTPEQRLHFEQGLVFNFKGDAGSMMRACIQFRHSAKLARNPRDKRAYDDLEFEVGQLQTRFERILARWEDEAA